MAAMRQALPARASTIITLAFIATTCNAGASLQDLRVCVVLESAFTMLRPGVALEAVTSDDQLRGFDVDLRRRILEQTNYSVQVLGSYGELNVAVRAGTAGGCDVGWAAFFQVAKRDRCNVGDDGSIARCRECRHRKRLHKATACCICHTSLRAERPSPSRRARQVPRQRAVDFVEMMTPTSKQWRHLR